MKKRTILTLTAGLCLSVLAVTPLKYQASDFTETEDGVEIMMLDGDYTYVDNEILMNLIAGEWVCEEQGMKLEIREDYSICITAGDTVLLETGMDFTFLQPGAYRDVDIDLEANELTLPGDETPGEIELFYTEMDFAQPENSRLVMEIWDADGVSSQEIYFTRVQENRQIQFTSITMEEAGAVFQNEGDYLIVDVRTEEEYLDGHIPNAVNVPNETIPDAAVSDAVTQSDAVEQLFRLLPDKQQQIYVYCRSGRRSKEASEKLAAMGYTSIIEFGGILDWSGDVETGQADNEQAKTEQAGGLNEENGSDVSESQADLSGIWEDENHEYVLELQSETPYSAVLYRKNQKVFETTVTLSNEDGYEKLEGLQGEMLNADCNNFNLVDHVHYDGENDRMELAVTYQGQRYTVTLARQEKE